MVYHAEVSVCLSSGRATRALSGGRRTSFPQDQDDCEVVDSRWIESQEIDEDPYYL